MAGGKQPLNHTAAHDTQPDKTKICRRNLLRTAPYLSQKLLVNKVFGNVARRHVTYLRRAVFPDPKLHVGAFGSEWAIE
jgi:hypothetical protein